MKLLILIIMIFLHIFDDYYLQGILASMKQKEWWDKNANDELYRHDYICALITHAFSWSFMILLPFTVSMIFNNNYSYVHLWICMLFENLVIHAFIDNLKANKRKISLVCDQMLHLAQIFLTWIVMEMIYVL